MNECLNSANPRFLARLPALPEFEPAPDLWARIAHRHARRRHARWAGGFGIAAALLLAVALVRLPGSISDVDPMAQQRLETLQLEQDLQALVHDGSASGFAQLRPLDVALQQAYDRHADGDELGQLWNQRNQRLRELIRNRQDVSDTDAPSDSRISI